MGPGAIARAVPALNVHVESAILTTNNQDTAEYQTHVPGHGLLMCAHHSAKRQAPGSPYSMRSLQWQTCIRHRRLGVVTPMPRLALAWRLAGHVFPRVAGAAQVDALVEGVAAQLPGMQRALCTRRTLRHVLLALQEERDALVVDGDDVYFTC